MIQLKNVTLRRSAKVLLDAASVTLNPGEKSRLGGPQWRWQIDPLRSIQWHAA